MGCSASRCCDRQEAMMTSAQHRSRLYALAVAAVTVIAIAISGYFFIVQQFDEETIRSARVSTEVANDDMVEIIVNTLSSDIERLVVAADQTTPSQDWKSLAEGAAFIDFDAKARHLALNTRIVKIKVYNRSGVTIYSTDLTQLGADYSKREEFVHALRGSSTSTIIQRDFFKSFTQEIKDATLVASYHPLKSATGEIIGVSEVYANRTKEFKLFEESVRMHSIVLALGISVISILIISMLSFFALVSSPNDD
jgi:hypothetical protein